MDHSKPCCTSCTTLSHRKCENVTLIKQAASGIKQSSKALGLSERLKDHIKHLSEIIGDRNKNLTDAENSMKDVATRVSNIKTELLHHIKNRRNTER